jgi:hypothetical protein
LHAVVLHVASDLLRAAVTEHSPVKIWRRILWSALALLGLLVAVLVIAVATMDRWLFAVLDPGAFDPSAMPPAPDYHLEASWAALPETEDGADVTIPELPAVDPAAAEVDVFYLHPTTFVGSQWNAAIDDPAVNEATLRGGTLIQASAFNGCCAVHAPRYRQANGFAYTHPSTDAEQAIEVAYADVVAAFEVFLQRTGERPFILAGHSQGAVLAGRLLRERIAGSKLEARLVAAYLPGAPLRAETIGIPVCETPTQTGCIVSWHARGPDFKPNSFEFETDRALPLAGRICVNPITWTTDGAHAPAERNAGALFFDTESPIVKPGFADAQCVDGTLVVTTIGDLERDFMSTLLLWVMGPGNYHPVEYQLFYVDLRNNAIARTEAF